VTAKVIMNEMGVYGISNLDIANGVLSTWLYAAIEKRFAAKLHILTLYEMQQDGATRRQYNN
jgi:hypothetical protein